LSLQVKTNTLTHVMPFSFIVYYTAVTNSKNGPFLGRPVRH